MNQKELQELKRQFKFENDKLFLRGIQEAYGKNRDGEASILFSRQVNPDFLEKEEGELYYDIFKRSLAGQFGKTLLEYAFDKADPQSLQLRDAFLGYKNGSLLQDVLFTELVEELLVKGDYRNPVYIVAGVFEYAAAELNNNRDDLGDNSIFRFVLVAICEAKLTNLGLIYSHHDNEVRRKINEEMEIEPAALDAFLYPVFTQRRTDLNHFLYHTKSAKNPNIALVEEYFHIPFISTAQEQQDGFTKVIENAFPDGLPSEVAMKFHENLSEFVNEESQEEGMVMINKRQIKNLLANSGAKAESLQEFDRSYQDILEDQEVAAINILEKGKVSLKAPSITINVKDDAIERIQAKEIDGKYCLVIEIDEGLQISGVPANLSIPQKEVRVIEPEDK